MNSERGASTADLLAYAKRLGFVACGVATLEPSRRGDALERWLRAGYAGTMRYLHRQARKREHPGAIVPGARMAVVVLENYLPTGSGDQESGVRSRRVKTAKYARGRDYHLALKERMSLLATWLRDHGAALAETWTDAGPVPERELAERAGLGWIGKNTMLIRPEAGSFCFIGTIFTDLALEPTSGPQLDRCGSCTRCLDACPTSALVEPRVLDATQCISYLTIESRLPIPDALAAKLEGWGFGCDICNDVCPWNVRFAASTSLPEYRDRREIASDTPEFFAAMDEVEFRRRFGDTPLERPGLSGMRRNWAAAFQSLEKEST